MMDLTERFAVVKVLKYNSMHSTQNLIFEPDIDLLSHNTKHYSQLRQKDIKGSHFLKGAGSQNVKLSALSNVKMIVNI